jgi:hypothetical protein
MYMPFPYNSTTPLHQVAVEIQGASIPVYLLLGNKPVDDAVLNVAKDSIRDFPFSKFMSPDMLDLALDKAAENHYPEHLKTNPGHTVSKSAFKKGLKPLSATLWIDGSWGVTFVPDTGILGSRHVCVSFPVDRPEFTSVIA